VLTLEKQKKTKQKPKKQIKNKNKNKQIKKQSLPFFIRHCIANYFPIFDT
jgi:ABC-type polysaccharide transport system permease subunit